MDTNFNNLNVSLCNDCIQKQTYHLDNQFIFRVPNTLENRKILNIYVKQSEKYRLGIENYNNKLEKEEQEPDISSKLANNIEFIPFRKSKLAKFCEEKNIIKPRSVITAQLVTIYKYRSSRLLGLFLFSTILLYFISINTFLILILGLLISLKLYSFKKMKWLGNFFIHKIQYSNPVSFEQKNQPQKPTSKTN